MAIQSEPWHHCSLGDLLRIKHGYAFKGEYFADKGPYILLTPGNFNADGGIRDKGDKEKFYVGPVPDEFLLNQGDLLVVMTDLTQQAPILGSAAFIPEDGKYLHNQRLGKVVDLIEDCVDSDFLYHLLNAQTVRAHIRATATGSTVRHTSPDRIYQVQVALPPLPTQRKIAAILSAYDDLIENNTRRIALLEEMARALYREWFVEFRYPGHEGVPLVESPLGPIPQGWRVVKLGEVASINPESIKRDDEPDVIEYVDIAAVSTGQIDSTESLSFADAPGRARRLVRDGDTIWATVRPNRRSYCLILRPSENMVVSTGFAVIRPNRAPFTYLYMSLTTEDFADYLSNRAKGSAYPAVVADDFEQAQVVLPPSGLSTQFHDAVVSMFEMKREMLVLNHNLRRTRDLLLPKLVSGEVDVARVETAKEIVAI